MKKKELSALLIVSVHAAFASAEVPGRHFAYNGFAFPLDPVAQGACVPTDLNDAGEVVGFNYRNANRSTNSLGFVTGENGVGSTPLSLGGKDSAATAINSKGQVIGMSTTVDSPISASAFITDPRGENIRPIGPLGASASAINDLGQITGELNGVAYITGKNGAGYRFIDSLGTFTSPTAINLAGQLTGQFSDQVSIYHAFVTGPDGNDMVDQNLPGSTYSIGLDINDEGQVIGEQWFGVPGHREQYIATQGAPTVKLLGTLGNLPGGRSEGRGINNKGIMVGISSKGDKYGRIYVTITGPDGIMRNLNRYVQNLPSGVYLTGNPVINNRNQIAASASNGLCYLVCPGSTCEAASGR